MLVQAEKEFFDDDKSYFQDPANSHGTNYRNGPQPDEAPIDNFFYSDLRTGDMGNPIEAGANWQFDEDIDDNEGVRSED